MNRSSIFSRVSSALLLASEIATSIPQALTPLSLSFRAAGIVAANGIAYFRISAARLSESSSGNGADRGGTERAGLVGWGVEGVHDDDAALHYEFDVAEDGDVRRANPSTSLRIKRRALHTKEVGRMPALRNGDVKPATLPAMKKRPV